MVLSKFSTHRMVEVVKLFSMSQYGYRKWFYQNFPFRVWVVAEIFFYVSVIVLKMIPCDGWFRFAIHTKSKVTTRSRTNEVRECTSVLWTN